MLAAAYPKQKHNIHMINIYNSYTLDEIVSLSDHSNVIMQINWKFDDKMLVSTGIDGTVAEWKVIEGKNKEWQSKKWNHNNTKYSSITINNNGKYLLVAGT